jgi:plastocyanin
MRLRLLIVAVVSAVAGTFFLPVMAERADRGASRTILLVARDMAFFVDGVGEPNPDIHVRPGEQITLTLRNEDAGMTHDVAISGWNASTRELRGTGTDRITVTVPAKKGTTEYVCRPHSLVMRGSFVID